MHKLQLKKYVKNIKKIKDAKRFKILGEIRETIETKNGNIIEVIVPPSKISSQKAAKKIKEKYNKIRRNKMKSRKIVDSNKKNKILKEMDAVDQIKTASDKKRTRITAQKIFKKYKNMKRPKRNFVVDEDDIETIDYNELLQEDVFAEESILNAANKVLDFEQFKKEQEKRLQEYNNQLLEDAETINYVDDVSLNDVKENKNLKMTAKKVSDKYRKIRQKRKTLHKISETFVPDKKSIKQVDKAAFIASKKISKKYKKLYGRL